VGSKERGVGCKVVGRAVGLGLGITDGNGLGDSVGMVVGEGVVGDGVLTVVGRGVGAGVGLHVVHSSVTHFSIPPAMKPAS